MDQTAPQQQAPQNPKSSQILKIIILAVILGAIAAAIVIAVQLKDKNQTLPSGGQIQEPPLPIVTLLDYRNPNHNFSFKYSQVWELAESAENSQFGSLAAYGFTFKNTLPEATAEAGPNLPKLVVLIFEKNNGFDAFAKKLAPADSLTLSDCPGSLKNCKVVASSDPNLPFGIQILIGGKSFDYGFKLLDQNAQIVINLDKIPQPLGAVIRNFQTN